MHRDLPQGKASDRCRPARRVRVLFGCNGWPSGIHEVASWTRRQELADVGIVCLPPSDGSFAVNEESTAAIRRFAERNGSAGRRFGKDGSLTDAARDALATLGGRFVEKLIEFNPHVVGFRLEGGGFPQVQRCVAAVRLFGDAEIVIGGPTATSHPREVLQDTGADYVFAGESERSFSQFLRLAWQRHSADRQPEIPGLAYRYGGRSYVNTLPRDGYGRTIMDVDHVVCSNTLRCLRNRVRPVAEADLIASNRLDWSLLDDLTDRFDSLYFTGGRGCPGSCTFCAKLHGNEVRNKSAGQLIEEIEAADARVAEGAIRVSQWNLFEHVDDPAWREQRVAWASIFDEDFLLDGARAIEFFRLWDQSELRRRYRISLQTNPCSLLAGDLEPHLELFQWIDRLKPMIQLGAESFHDELLTRWNKRHRVGQLHRVLDALDDTGQDYTVFQLLSDFETTPEELVETLRLLILSGLKHRRMRIASSPLTIPLYDSDTRRRLEFGGRLPPGRVRHFTDFERPQPGWMDPLAAELADLADAELQFALNPEHREAALCQAMEAVLKRIGKERQSWRILHLRDQAERAMDQIKEVRFQAIGAPASGERSYQS